MTNKLAVYFSYGTSLKTWYDLGVWSRQKDIYSAYSAVFDKLCYISYDRSPFGEILTPNSNYCINSLRIKSFFYQFLIPFLHKKEIINSDVLLTVQMSGSFPAIISKMLYKIPLVIHCGYFYSKHVKRSSNIFNYYRVRLLEYLAYKYSDLIIVTSNEHYNYLASKVPKKQLLLITNAINTSTFAPKDTKVSGEGVCCVSKLTNQKNLFSLIDAVSRLKVKLKLVGEGPLENKLKSFAEEKKARVSFLGNVPNEKLPSIINESKYFIFPSFYEGSPKALLEAMSCQIPVIASDIPEHREVIKSMENGVLCGLSAEDIVTSYNLLEGDEILRNKIALNARNHILRNFDITVLLKKEAETVKNLCLKK